MAKLNTTTSGIITATLTADSSPTLELQQNGVTIRTLGQSQLVSGTAQDTSTGATAYDFTGIPSWAKRITVMFAGVSTNGTNNPLVQIGTSSGIESTGYVSTSASVTNAAATTASNNTTGFVMRSAAAVNIISGQMSISLIGNNLWVSSHAAKNDTNTTLAGSGDKTLAGILDRIRITTVGGTDTFDAGSVNIMWE